MTLHYKHNIRTSVGKYKKKNVLARGSLFFLFIKLIINKFYVYLQCTYIIYVSVDQRKKITQYVSCTEIVFFLDIKIILRNYTAL